ncbi:MAG TPA: NAD(P)/FAD-dependent oxidoreductase [Anaerolineae bacterium]|nr:NAD(P)/FAD-dependent oxidoreductase [Anaerolineae bacterium]
MSECDIIVIGGGHNGLICAGYLAKAGENVIVLEKHDVVGGFITTEEAIPEAPGFKLNIGAMEHGGVVETPIVADLELEKFGLEYMCREEMYFFPFLDGVAIPIYKSLDKTCEAIAEISEKDAEAYRGFVEFSNALLSLFGAVSYGAPPSFGELAGAMGGGGAVGMDADRLIRTVLTSPRAVVDEWFESEYLKAALAYYGSVSQTAPSTLGSGWAPCLLAGCHSSGQWRPRGGGGMLIESLIRAIEHHGGAVRASAEVTKIVVENGRAAAVELRDGERIEARHGIVSSIDAKRVFLDLMDPALLDPQLIRQVKNITVAGSNVSEFKVDCALDELPSLDRWEKGPEFIVSMIQPCPSVDYLEHEFDDIRRGEFPEAPAVLCAVPSAADPSLAPPGKHTLWLSCFAPYELSGGRSWDDIREETADHLIDVIAQYTPNIKKAMIGRVIHTPLDWYRRTGAIAGNPNHMDMTLDQLFGYRPTPALSDYRTPIKELYLSGSGVHPGGGLNGIPGHNTAQVVLEDLGYIKSASGAGLGQRISKLKDLFQSYMKLRKYL